MRTVVFIFASFLAQSLYVATAFGAQKLLDVPFSHQSQAFTCGHESLRMVLAYWGKRESREEILMRLGANSTNAEIIEKVIKKDYKDFLFEPVTIDMPSIKKQIDQGRPIMVGADASNLSYLEYDAASGHMVVLVGYDDAKNLVFIRDPNSPYIEQLSFEQVSEAVYDQPKSAFVIYKPNVSPASGPAKHFDKSFPLGTKKEDKGIPIAWILPALHLTYETEPRLDLYDSFKKSSKRQNRHFALTWNGFSYGDQTLEQTPWLGNGKAFHTTGFGAAWVIGSKLRLGPTELLSPGVYSFGRHRSLDIYKFSKLKRIPALRLPKNTVEVTGYMKAENEETLAYDSLGLEATAWSGARVGWRRGASEEMGHFSAGVSAGKVNLKLDDDDSQQYTTGTLNYDVRLGIIKGSLQKAELPRSQSPEDRPHDGVSVAAYSLAMDYDLSSWIFGIAPIEALNRMGAFRPHIEMTQEVVKRMKSETDLQTITTRRWDVELPVPLRVVDMTYGSGIEQTLKDNGIKDSQRSAWVRFAFNAYQPWVQLNLGYRVIYKDFSTAIGQQMSFGMFAGI
ncbi:MAG: C39 family peptidase [bacterium]